MNSPYPYKVGWCPLCDQGWQEIVKDKKKKTLLVMCSECESEWSSPTHLDMEHIFHDFNRSIQKPSLEDIESSGWKQYILTE